MRLCLQESYVIRHNRVGFDRIPLSDWSTWELKTMALSSLLQAIQFFVEHDGSDSSISFQKELIQEG